MIWTWPKKPFDGLMDYDPGTTARTDSESMLSDDGKTYTFKLRKGVQRPGNDRRGREIFPGAIMKSGHQEPRCGITSPSWVMTGRRRRELTTIPWPSN